MAPICRSAIPQSPYHVRPDRNCDFIGSYRADLQTYRRVKACDFRGADTAGSQALTPFGQFGSATRT
jgi:hypothetical protein